MRSISRGKASLLHGMNTEVGVSLGMKRKRQQYQNNGRPPDTTDALAKAAPKKSKKAKKSSNFIKAPGQGYASYLAANDNPAQAN
ncbi:hypothetical protein PTTG_00872 [Puccinia triticina 1-1 BBBD Race 1]|uniref:Uncharacterized protein n=1 Tax=Puccinia triticina (isolate 1-1 / race 1 (BBBD)) TaxID=630390 RepID=A0A0C4EJF4_PUCT1|nr:hypothetical protein PTTG_00872 [Puccinia triticina 1-1 BBBD Race 1]